MVEVSVIQNYENKYEITLRHVHVNRENTCFILNQPHFLIAQLCSKRIT